jgi:excisionase family DNA binding protein
MSAHLTVKETAAMLRCAPATLYNRLCAGQLEFLRPRKVLGKWLIPAEAVEQVLEQGERRALGLVRGGKR